MNNNSRTPARILKLTASFVSGASQPADAAISIGKSLQTKLVRGPMKNSLAPEAHPGLPGERVFAAAKEAKTFIPVRLGGFSFQIRGAPAIRAVRFMHVCMRQGTRRGFYKGFYSFRANSWRWMAKNRHWTLFTADRPRCSLWSTRLPFLYSTTEQGISPCGHREDCAILSLFSLLNNLKTIFYLTR